MARETKYDLRGASFDQFVSFIFRSSIKGEHGKKFWYWEAGVAFEPHEIATHYIRLFTEPQFLLERFVEPTLEAGFWAIQSVNLDCGVPHIMWTEELPFAVRQTCVRSMFHLFERLFALEPLDTASNMWWDSLCYDWHCGNRFRANGGEDLRMQDVIFETLNRILRLDSVPCQTAALHGLGHLHHPDTERVIEQYLQGNPMVSPKLRDYALAAAKFDIQ
jgi:hypothetical protein